MRKTTSGRRRHNVSDVSRANTWRRSSSRGDRARTAGNTDGRATDSRSDQGPEGEAANRGAGWKHAVAICRQRREGTWHRRGVMAGREGKPLQSEPWTWLWGETNPRGRWRSKPSRACETPRAERWQARNPVTRTLPIDVAKRERQPQGRSSASGGAGRRRDGKTLKRSKAYESMKPFARAGGGRRLVKVVSTVSETADRLRRWANR